MSCLEYRRRGKVRGPVDYVCIDPDDLCRYMGGLVNEGTHQFENGECIVCGASIVARSVAAPDAGRTGA